MRVLESEWRCSRAVVGVAFLFIIAAAFYYELNEKAGTLLDNHVTQYRLNPNVAPIKWNSTKVTATARQATLKSRTNFKNKQLLEAKNKEAEKQEEKPKAPSISAELETTSKELYMVNNYRPRRGHYCNVHDYSIDIDTADEEFYKCVRTRSHPPVVICIYPIHMDIFVSGSILARGSWELNINTAILNALKRYPQAAFLDIGANLGMHSLVVAQSGRNVVAVEPKWSTIKRLQKSVKLNKLTERFVLVKNAIFDERGTLTLYSDNTNQGGSSLKQPLKHEETILTILFDDLLEVFHDEQAIIKMDIEASECRALVNSTRFFSTVKVHAIFMEFMNLRRNLGGESMGKLKMCVLNMVAYLRSLGFVPREIDIKYRFVKKPPLLDSTMRIWPNDIVWTRSMKEINNA